MRAATLELYQPPGERAWRLRREGTDAERKLWSRLRNRQLGGAKFRRQYPIPPYVADFCCVEARFIVELDGGQHAERSLEDARRTASLEAKGYRVLRFWDNQALTETEAVLEVIYRALVELDAVLPSP